LETEWSGHSDYNKWKIQGKGEGKTVPATTTNKGRSHEDEETLTVTWTSLTKWKSTSVHSILFSAAWQGYILYNIYIYI